MIKLSEDMKFNEKEMGDCENSVIFALLKNTKLLTH